MTVTGDTNVETGEWEDWTLDHPDREVDDSEKTVVVWVRTSFLQEVEATWYSDEETQEEFLARVKSGIECGDFAALTMSAAIDKIAIVKDPDSLSERLAFWA